MSTEPDFIDCGAPAQVMSPCINVCALDPATGWCTGCGRSGAEIAAWTSVDDAERQRIVDRLPPRLARLRQS